METSDIVKLLKVVEDLCVATAMHSKAIEALAGRIESLENESSTVVAAASPRMTAYANLKSLLQPKRAEGISWVENDS